MQRKEIAPARIAAIEEFINEYCTEHGTAPSMQKIANHLGLGKTTVFHYLKRMENEGRIESRGNRGYFTAAQLADRNESIAPIVGNVACGTPILAIENIEEYVRLPESLFGRGDFYLLRAKGNSMIGVGIYSGDLVIVRKQDTAIPGQIIVAYDEDSDGATLKRYFPEPEKGRVRLHPENPDEKEVYIPIKDFHIQGVAVKVIKNL